MSQSAEETEMTPPRAHNEEGDDPTPISITTQVRILYATQSGRAKACARRTARILATLVQPTTNSSSISTSNLPTTITHTNTTMPDAAVSSTLDTSSNSNPSPRSGPVILQNGAGDSFDQDMNHLGQGNIVSWVHAIRRTALSDVSFPTTPHGRILLVLFVSTTGEGEQTESIQQVWAQLLHASLPRDLWTKMELAVFCLGDRAYGPHFCAAGRKLTVRLLQLGATLSCAVGYGDDGTPNGGVFADLDEWLTAQFLPAVWRTSTTTTNQRLAQHPGLRTISDPVPAYQVFVENHARHDPAVPPPTASNHQEEWQQSAYAGFYREYFASLRPRSAYWYDSRSGIRQRLSETDYPSIVETIRGSSSPPLKSLLLGTVVENRRITADGWEQDTRHIVLQLDLEVGKVTNAAPYSGDTMPPLPYQAGDVIVVLPANPEELVERMLHVLPDFVRIMADVSLRLEHQTMQNTRSSLWGVGFLHWPTRLTLRGWLTYCADIHALPEREDLRALAACCSLTHPHGIEQRDKLEFLSHTTEGALYVDYILREKRNWVDVIYDFDSLRHDDSKLTLESLFSLLGPMRPREFSIASSPSHDFHRSRANVLHHRSWGLELCVAVVKGTSKRGRFYHGLCSDYLSKCYPMLEQNSSQLDVSFSPSQLRLWIRPGSFQGIPLSLHEDIGNQPFWKFEIPILCIGAGTGIAPLRSILLEREAIRNAVKKRNPVDHPNTCSTDMNASTNSIETYCSDAARDNILFFGCRREQADFYYGAEWEKLQTSGRLGLFTAFSQDQNHKVYVQHILRSKYVSNGFLARHLLERSGAIFIAGGPTMAGAVKEEITTALNIAFDSDAKKTNQFLRRAQRSGFFRVESWS